MKKKAVIIGNSLYPGELTIAKRAYQFLQNHFELVPLQIAQVIMAHPFETFISAEKIIDELKAVWPGKPVDKKTIYFLVNPETDVKTVLMNIREVQLFWTVEIVLLGETNLPEAKSYTRYLV